jgi:IMP cyclohydrolase
MQNPNGPYPGRQLFLGLTKENKPAFAYLVTGRSLQSRERRATIKGSSIIIGPIGNVPYDSLKHYTAIKFDSNIGLMAVSNGIQTEAIFETYKLLSRVKSKPNSSYLKKIMDGANYEPDGLKTPRISGVITNSNDSNTPVYIVGIKTAGKPAFVWSVKPKPGTYYGISTYHGNMEKPRVFRAGKRPAKIRFSAITSHEIADYIYEISAADYHGDDIRVCAVGGVRGTNHTWKIALVNRHKS